MKRVNCFYIFIVILHISSAWPLEEILAKRALAEAIVELEEAVKREIIDSSVFSSASSSSESSVKSSDASTSVITSDEYAGDGDKIIVITPGDSGLSSGGLTEETSKVVETSSTVETTSKGEKTSQSASVATASAGASSSSKASELIKSEGSSASASSASASSDNKSGLFSGGSSLLSILSGGGSSKSKGESSKNAAKDFTSLGLSLLKGGRSIFNGEIHRETFHHFNLSIFF